LPCISVGESDLCNVPLNVGKKRSESYARAPYEWTDNPALDVVKIAPLLVGPTLR